MNGSPNTCSNLTSLLSQSLSKNKQDCPPAQHTLPVISTSSLIDWNPIDLLLCQSPQHFNYNGHGPIERDVLF